MPPSGLPGPQGVSASASPRPSGRPLLPRHGRRRPRSVPRSVRQGVPVSYTHLRAHETSAHL
eukprot:14243761-Alexandrium_andersonii.AAC.1